MANEDIKKAAKDSKVKLWQIAKEFGIRDSELSKYLREELETTDKKNILCIIEKLAKK